VDRLIRQARRSPTGWILAFSAAGATGALAGIAIALVGGWPATVTAIVGAAIALLVVGRALTRPSAPVGVAANLSDTEIDAALGTDPAVGKPGTTRVRLRHFHEVDAATGAFEATIDDEVVRWQGWTEAHVAELRRRAGHLDELRALGFLAVSDGVDDRVLGVVSLTVPPETPGLAWFGVWLGPDARGRGFAAAAVALAARLAWAEGATEMTMGTVADNTAMVRSFTRAGATLQQRSEHVLPNGDAVESLWYRMGRPDDRPGDDPTVVGPDDPA
jgi:RimJ/RimL family protein N-acetyltransferase